MAIETIKHAWRSLRVTDLPLAIRRLFGLAEPGGEAYAMRPSDDEKTAARKAVRAIRTPAPPSIFVHGVLPRSGTNFAANLLALHPDVAAFPRQMWEMPILPTARASLAWRHEWLARFPENEPLVTRFEPLAWSAAGLMQSLQTDSMDKRMLFKSPHMRHLTLFDSIFPDDTLVMVVRDGRDVIASSQKTFKDRFVTKSFRQLLSEWQMATELAFELANDERKILWRYEDLVADPESALRRDLPRIGLDPSRFPFERLADLPVFGSSSDRRQGSDRWNPVTKQSDFNPVGRGRSLPARQLAAIERHAGSLLAKAGYA